MHSKDSLNKLCKFALHKERIEQLKIEVENRKWAIFFSGIILSIMILAWFFEILFVGFDRVAVAINQVIVKAETAYKESLKGGWMMTEDEMSCYANPYYLFRSIVLGGD